jgi:hypothetical protein
MSPAQVLEKLQVPPNEPHFNSLTPEKLASLEAAFAQNQKHKALRTAGVSVGVLVVGGFVLGGTAYASPPGGGGGGGAAASIQTGVQNAIAMIQAIDGIGLAAFGVALAPMGFMTTLRVLNMVLSRV